MTRNTLPQHTAATHCRNTLRFAALQIYSTKMETLQTFFRAKSIPFALRKNVLLFYDKAGGARHIQHGGIEGAVFVKIKLKHFRR